MTDARTTPKHLRPPLDIATDFLTGLIADELDHLGTFAPEFRSDDWNQHSLQYVREVLTAKPERIPEELSNLASTLAGELRYLVAITMQQTNGGETSITIGDPPQPGATMPDHHEAAVQGSYREAIASVAETTGLLYSQVEQALPIERYREEFGQFTNRLEDLAAEAAAETCPTVEASAYGTPDELTGPALDRLTAAVRSCFPAGVA